MTGPVTPPTSRGTPPPGVAGLPTARDADVENASVGEMLGDISRDLSTLLRQELALAKAEIKHEATKAGKGAGMLGGAGFAGYMVVLFLSFAAWWALANVMDEGLAALIVAVVWAVAAAVLYVTGRKQLRELNPVPERTVDTLKQVPDAIKPHEERS
jgi:Putative Actinobacterial Holin-X, holin superfamily III